MANFDILQNATTGLYKEVKKNIDMGNNPNATNKDGYSVLMLAIRGPIKHKENYRASNKIKTVNTLIANGANINYKINNSSPLFFAIEYGELDIVKLLLTCPDIDKSHALMCSIKQLCWYLNYHEFFDLDHTVNILDFIKMVDNEIRIREDNFTSPFKRQFDILVELLISGASELEKSIPEFIIDCINKLKYVNAEIMKLHFELVKIIFIYSSTANVSKLIQSMMDIDYEALQEKRVQKRGVWQNISNNVKQQEANTSLVACIKDIHLFYVKLYNRYNVNTLSNSWKKFNKQEPELAEVFQTNVSTLLTKKFVGLPQVLHSEIMSYEKNNLIELIYTGAVKLTPDLLKLFEVVSNDNAKQRATELLIRMTDYGAINIPEINAERQRQEAERQRQEAERQSKIQSELRIQEADREIENSTWGATNFLKTISTPYQFIKEQSRKVRGLGKKKRKNKSKKKQNK
jgi:hypothetical protein